MRAQPRAAEVSRLWIQPVARARNRRRPETKARPARAATTSYVCEHYSRFTTREVLAMAIDPVCKMHVDEKKAAATSEYKGKTYYFCAQICKTKFEKEPDRYTK